MSNALAVAATSFVLVDLLNNGLIDRNISGIGNITVNALPPDRINIQDGSQLALFLYNVSPNPGYRNAGLPGRDAAGNRISNPPLALDLHYLLIAFGAEPLHAEILLGYAMQLLHETPVLTRDAIRKSLAGPTQVPPGGGSVPAALLNLYTSDLADQVEMIKITQQILTLDELTNLWTSFQTQYRLCAAYQASVVLIESHASTRNPLPVKSRTIQAIPFQKPSTDSVGSPKAPTAPTVTATVSNLQGTGSAPRSGNLNLTLDPPVGPFQRVTVLLNQLAAPTSPPSTVAPPAYSFPAPSLFSLQSPPSSPPVPTNTLVVPFAGVAPGVYLVRAQVDGADSLLATDANGVYANPQVTVT
jgi:hypothetical protein